MAARAKAPRPPLARALRYAEQVIEGRIPACVFVRQACERQLRDLSRRRWPYRFDPLAAERICRFAELLPHIKGPMAGQRIELAPWQAFILTTAFGWVRADTGKRRFRRSTSRCRAATARPRCPMRRRSTC
jgi:phage terminase large subunit-like protein